MKLEARLLGTFRLSIDGRVVDADAFERPSGLRLLKLLLATPGHRIVREVAAELLAPEAEPGHSRVKLRKAIHFARRALEASGVPGSVIGGGVAIVELDPSAVEIEIDVDRLRAAVDAVRAAAAADRTSPTAQLEVLAELGGLGLLPDDAFDEALVGLGERLHREAVEALGVGIDHARDVRRSGLALRLIDCLLQLEPAEEAAHRHAIELHVEARRTDAARRQLVLCAAALADAYGIEPTPDLRALVEQPSSTAARSGTGDVATLLIATLVDAVATLAGDRTRALALVESRTRSSA